MGIYVWVYIYGYTYMGMYGYVCMGIYLWTKDRFRSFDTKYDWLAALCMILYSITRRLVWRAKAFSSFAFAPDA